MTEEQRKIAEENHNLIYYFLHKHNLPIDEYYDLCAIAYCKAIMTFDESKGFELATYVCKCMKNEVGTYERKKKSVMRGYGKKTISYNELVKVNDNKVELQEIIPSNVNIEDDVITKIMFDCALGKLEPKLKQVIMYRIDGYEQCKIGKMVGLSQPHVRRVIRKFAKEVCSG